MENYIRYSFIKHIQHQSMNGCKQNVIQQRGLQYDVDGTHKNNKTLNKLKVIILAQRIKVVRELTEIEVEEILKEIAA